MSITQRFDLTGKVAIVTGASSGIGVAFAKGMAEGGADVVIGARRVDKLEDTKKLIEDAGRRGLAVRTDVTVVEECQALVDAAMKEFGRVDILINNAGGGDGNSEHAPATEESPEHFRWLVDLNMMSSYWMCQAAGRVMEPGSSVINISSVVALTTAKMPAAAYSAAKSGLLGLTRDLAAQWAPNIRVNALMPGTFPSEQTQHYSENYKNAVIKARIPMGRIGDPEDLATTAVFLASDASNYITGVSLAVDGGILLT